MNCLNCGKVNPQSSRFCVSCGTPIMSASASSTSNSTNQRMKPPENGKATLKKRWIDSLMIVVAVILIIMGIGYMGITWIGITVKAQVMDIEQVLFVNNDSASRNPSRYKLEYQFMVKGQSYHGSVTRVFRNGSHMKSTISVRYLPFWPHVNTEDGTEMVLVGPVMLGLGIFIFCMSVKGKKLREP